MQQGQKMRLSHVLYRVDNLHRAVNQVREAGFHVEYGTPPAKAYNAMIWFGKGVFIELYNNPGLSRFRKALMKLFGYGSILKRMSSWQEVRQGWCAWVIETPGNNLETQRAFLRERNTSFTSHQAKKTDAGGRNLTWDMLFPADLHFPFMMSVYSPDPRPNQSDHPNGITGIESIVVGKDGLNLELLNELLFCGNLELKEGCSGVQTVKFKNTLMKIEDILIPDLGRE